MWKIWGREIERNRAKRAGCYYKTWRIYQMSDHLPLGIGLKINFSKEYLFGGTGWGRLRVMMFLLPEGVWRRPDRG